MNYRVRAVRQAADLPPLEDTWTKLLSETPGTTVFASYQWNSTWWRYFGGSRKLFILTVWTENGELAGIAPLMIGQIGPVRRLQFVGTGLSDYGDFLVHPRYKRDVVPAILAYLSARHTSWDLADLGEVPAGSSLLEYLRSNNPQGVRAALIPQTPCPFIDLPSTWESYVSSLERKRRYYISSFPRKFMREHSGEVEIACDSNAVERAVETFHALHMSRWAEKANELSEEHVDRAFEPFLRDVCGAIAERGWLRVMSLRAGESTVAASINFLLHGRWSAYMKGFDPAWSSARPGTVLDSLRIKQAIEEGAEIFDFGRGDEAYKSGYGLVLERNTRVLLGSNAPRSLLAYGALLARIRYKNRKMEQNLEASSTEGD